MSYYAPSPSITRAVGVHVGQVLDDLGLPAAPVDGDCGVWEPRVTNRLAQAGYPVAPWMVVGWVYSGEQPAVGFLHRVSVVDGVWVVDGTARQFDPQAPSPWVEERYEYCRVLAEMTGLLQVTAGLDLGHAIRARVVQGQ